MSIEVRYFASLREQFGREGETLDFGSSTSVAEVWAQVSDGEPMPSNLLMAVNLEYVGADEAVKDGDEVAFFPPVTGG